MTRRVYHQLISICAAVWCVTASTTTSAANSSIPLFGMTCLQLTNRFLVLGGKTSVDASDVSTHQLAYKTVPPQAWQSLPQQVDTEINSRPGATFTVDSTQSFLYALGGRDDTAATLSTISLEDGLAGAVAVSSASGDPFPVITRWDHSMTTQSFSGDLLLFGGRTAVHYALNDVWRFDVAVGTWTQLKEASSSFNYGTLQRPAALNVIPARYGASAVMSKQQDSLLVYGGQADNGTNYFNELWQYDLSIDMWSCQSVNDTNAPNTKSRSSISIFEQASHEVLLVLGYDTLNSSVLYSFNMTSRVWSSSSMAQIRPRTHHCITADSTSQMVYIFGGIDISTSVIMRDLWVIDFKSVSTSTSTMASSMSQNALASPSVLVDMGSTITASSQDMTSSPPAVSTSASNSDSSYTDNSNASTSTLGIEDPSGLSSSSAGLSQLGVIPIIVGSAILALFLLSIPACLILRRRLRDKHRDQDVLNDSQQIGGQSKANLVKNDNSRSASQIELGTYGPTAADGMSSVRSHMSQQRDSHGYYMISAAELAKRQRARVASGFFKAGETTHNADTAFSMATTIRPEQTEFSLPGFMKYENGVHYKVLEEIARGAGSSIHIGLPLCADLSNSGTKIIVKKVDEVDLFEQEIVIMHFLTNHPESQRHFVKFLGYTEEPAAIIMPFYPYGSLEKWLRSSMQRNTETEANVAETVLTKSILLRFAMDIALAVEFMHSSKISHCDLKSANVLLTMRSNPTAGDPKLHCVLTDFGISRIFNDKAELVGAFNQVAVAGGSMSYVAPELLQRLQNFRNNVSVAEPSAGTYLAMDLYSTGIIIYELLHPSRQPWF